MASQYIRMKNLVKSSIYSVERNGGFVNGQIRGINTKRKVQPNKEENKNDKENAEQKPDVFG